MNQKRYLWILYIITTIIVMTIAIQGYWNYKNFLVNEQQFKNEIQISLDNAIENYYADIAKTDHFTFIDYRKDTLFNKPPKDSIVRKIKFDSDLLKNIFNDKNNRQYKNDTISISVTDLSTETVNTSKEMASWNSKEYKNASINRGKMASDSLKLLKGISAIYVSITRDSLDFPRLNSFIEKEFNRKKLSVSYALRHYKNNSVIGTFNKITIKNNYFKTFAKSAYLRQNEKLELLFSNETNIILKRGLFGALLSSLLSLAIISSLFYLLSIIKKQKELVEIKNDLIGNITHEFKTPITTISTAIEALQNFDAIDNKEKTKNYLSISSIQLKKLDLMVEKLLEIATLDSKNLMLKKETIDIVSHIEKCLKKLKLANHEKEITFTSNVKVLNVDVDTFHFENAITNLVDNAIKYGGDIIEVTFNSVLSVLEINIADNGIGIDKKYKDMIFDKFYRIPKGNRHDIKGFGIGLYYAKQIIEKHKGTITLVPNTKKTVFKIIMNV